MRNNGLIIKNPLEKNMDPFTVPKQPHIIQQILCFSLLLPLTLCSWLITFILIVPLFPIYKRTKPPLKNRLMKYAAFLILFSLRIYPKLIDVSEKTSSRILVSNHVSIIDSLLFLYHFGLMQPMQQI